MHIVDVQEQNTSINPASPGLPYSLPTYVHSTHLHQCAIS